MTERYGLTFSVMYCACVRACICASVRASVRACVCVCVRPSVRTLVCVCACLFGRACIRARVRVYVCE